MKNEIAAFFILMASLKSSKQYEDGKNDKFDICKKIREELTHQALNTLKSQNPKKLFIYYYFVSAKYGQIVT